MNLEVTESVPLLDIESTICKLEELKQLGITISMDDFGTGFSSLNHIRFLPSKQTYGSVGIRRIVENELIGIGLCLFEAHLFRKKAIPHSEPHPSSAITLRSTCIVTELLFKDCEIASRTFILFRKYSP